MPNACFVAYWQVLGVQTDMNCACDEAGKGAPAKPSQTQTDNSGGQAPLTGRGEERLPPTSPTPYPRGRGVQVEAPPPSGLIVLRLSTKSPLPPCARGGPRSRSECRSPSMWTVAHQPPQVRGQYSGRATQYAMSVPFTLRPVKGQNGNEMVCLDRFVGVILPVNRVASPTSKSRSSCGHGLQYVPLQRAPQSQRPGLNLVLFTTGLTATATAT